MFGASLYIVWCSARNRSRQRFRRLGEPRYLIGAIAGIGYLLFTLVIRSHVYGDARAGSGPTPAGAATLFGVSGPTIGGVLLACAAVGSWALPFRSGLLDFSSAETTWLFPAPLTRRQLVAHRLMRSQTAVFTGALIMALAYPTGSIAARLRGLLAVWVLLMTCHVFFTGVTLARAGIRSGVRRVPFMWPAVLLPGGAALGVLLPVLAESQRSPVQIVPLLDLVSLAAEHGPARGFLWPFVLLARPLFVQGTLELSRALTGSLAVYAVSAGWLFWADAMSAEAEVTGADHEASRRTRRAPSYAARELGWRLSPVGRAEVLFVWKGMLQTFRTVERRVLFRALVMLATLLGASRVTSRAGGLVMVFGVFATWAALFMVFMGPQIVRTDLRQDLAHLELLKSWPLRGSSVVRGEIVWPAILVTAVTWAFGAAAMVLSMMSFSRVPPFNRAAAWLAFLIVIPGVVLTQYMMHNAVAVIFPGWVSMGASRPRGVDAVGQRLILLAGNWLGLLIALAPGIAFTVALSLLLRPTIGPFVLPIGALVTTLILVGEVWVVTAALGRIYERLDLTSVDRSE